MYHHHQHHQGKNSFSNSMLPIPPERHLFLHGGNGPGETGLVLSTDAKPRLKWTPELHERFVEAVNQLGGADSEGYTETVMKLMGIPGLTLYHLKSHLQKYRLSKNLHGQATNGTNKNGCMAGVMGDRIPEASGVMSNTSHNSQSNKSLQISEALQMQIEVQRRLHEQLEVQRHLQLRIEAQGKYLQAVLEKAQETLGRPNLGSIGLEATKVQLSELVSKVSTECLNSAFSELKEVPGLCLQQTQTTQPTDCSMESCLTSCEGSQRDQEIHDKGMALRPYHETTPLEPKEIGKDTGLGQTELTWSEDLKDNKIFHSAMGRDTKRNMLAAQRSSSDLSMRIGFQGEKGSGGSSFSVGRSKEKDDDKNFCDQANIRPPAVQVDNSKILKEYRLPYFTEKLDLNARDENDAASSCQQFDLNGFSWS